MSDLNSKVCLFLREKELFFLRTFLDHSIVQLKAKIAENEDMTQLEDRYDQAELENILISLEYAIKKQLKGSA